MNHDLISRKGLHVGDVPQDTAVVLAQFLQTLAELAAISIQEPGVTKAVRREDLEWWTGLVTLARRMRLGPAGGLMITDAQGRDPVGGDLGPGTVNVATGFYLNGVAYTSP